MLGMKRRAPTALPTPTLLTIGVSALALIGSIGFQARPFAQTAPQVKAAQPSPATGTVTSASNHRQTLDRYCVTCHNQRLLTGGLKLDDADVANPGDHAEIW